MHSIDRINNNGNYEPSNCKWSSKKEQQRNREITQKITIEGVTYTIAELAELSKHKFDTIKNRVKKYKTLAEIINPSKNVFKDGLKLGGIANGLKKNALTHCKYGHEFDLQNTHITPQGWRRCRKCHAITEKERRLNIKN